MLSIALYLLTHAMLLSLHLSGGSFPRPLSAQEEKKYVERMLAGEIEARVVRNRAVLTADSYLT